MQKTTRWIRSKKGLTTIVGVFVATVLVVTIGQVAGWWDVVGALTGTAGLATVPVPEYAAPAGGYTCLPSCPENDGKFFALVGDNMKSLGGVKITAWIAVPAGAPTFQVGIFDGDSGKDGTGAFNMMAGNWDSTTTESTYTLYADPMKDGAGTQVVATWRGNTDPMPNNGWFTVDVPQSPAAKAPSGHYFYRIEAVRPVVGSGINAFKLRSSGYLITGKSTQAGNLLGIVGMLYTKGDRAILYPQFQNSANTGPSNYSGDWSFSFYVPASQSILELWDGDFDRGTQASLAQDTDDPNTEGKPAFANQFAVDERAGGQGAPADDNTMTPILRRDPAAMYELIDPLGAPLYANQEPSGTEEWEKFTMGTQADANPDMLVEQIKPGFYQVHIKGLDLYNSVWLNTNYEICDPDNGCGPCVWPGCDNSACPRTIGYWKNNVQKVLINKKTNGVQESPETLDWALKNVALGSKVFRTGINVAAPVAIASSLRLTDQEADMILQRDQKTYPGGKDQANSMLARALQQNLAAWLNLGSGKIADNTVVTLNVNGGPFTGTVWEALQEAETIILTGGNLERAKDIGDQINNGNLGEDANVTECNPTDYAGKIPPDKQPPKHKDMPKAPKPTEPPYVPPSGPPVCNVPATPLAGSYAIIALNPAPCQGEQNGLLFHGTSLTQLDGTAFSNGCVRAVGTTSVEVTAPVEYVVEQFGDMSLINMGVQQVPQPLPESAWRIAPPNCSDPLAVQMDGKDFTGDMYLAPGLYCISGDVTVNSNDKLIGNGVTLYFTDGKLTINGGATVQLTAPPQGDAPALPGVLFYVPDSNSNPVLIAGNSDSYFSGVVYAPASEIEVLGTGYVFGYQAQFVGWDVRVGGTADVVLDFQSNGTGVCK
jgi:hypothetical protein